MNFALLEKAVKKRENKTSKKEENNTQNVDAVKFFETIENNFDLLGKIMNEETAILEVFDSLLSLDNILEIDPPMSFSDIEILL